MPIELTRKNEFAVLTLNRPEALNALDFGLVREIGRALDDVADSDARALLVTGAGDRAFCAGADVKELSSHPLLAQKRKLSYGQAVFAKLDTLPMPSIAVVNGYAFGGGFELALACTFRLAGSNARFALPEIKLGMIPGYGGTQRLPALIGSARALELILTGRQVDADEALALGIANRVAQDDPLEAAMAFAREFSSYGLPASWLARQAVLRAGDGSLHEGMKNESDLAAIALSTHDASEGMSAFIEKRKPVFKDR